MQSTAAASSNGGSDLTAAQQQQQQMWMQQQQQYQQQWIAAMQQQYPMMMQQQQQQQIIYPPQPHHYIPFHPHHHLQQFQQQQQGYMQHQLHHHHRRHHNNNNNTVGGGGGSSEDNRTIWIGDLQQWMDEVYLNTCFSPSGEISSVKVIRNKHTGNSERYGFIEFTSHSSAEKVLQSFNGSQMPNSDQVFRLNWATFGTGDKRTEPGSELSIFVGDLAPDVTDAVLNDTFSSKFPSIRGARVVVDPSTGRSKGYGFVRFGDDNERTRAISEMNGMYCSSRPMRIGAATPKKQMGQQQQQQYSSQAVVLSGEHASNGAMPQNGQSDGGSSNTTLFVGGLDSDVTDEDLRQSFSQYGEVVSIKIPSGKGCGFVQFATRSNAEDAMEGMSGATIGKQTVRISWGRNPVNKQFRADYNYQSNGAYYGRQGYGYAVAASNGYGNQQQSVS